MSIRTEVIVFAIALAASLDKAVAKALVAAAGVPASAWLTNRALAKST